MPSRLVALESSHCLPAVLGPQEAVNQAMLEKSVARAVDTGDRKVNLVMRAISSLEERLEWITNNKADLGVVALKSELDSSSMDARAFTDERVQVSAAQANRSARIDARVCAAARVTADRFCPDRRNSMLRCKMGFRRS